MVAKSGSGFGLKTVDERQHVADTMRDWIGRSEVVHPGDDVGLIWLSLSMGNQALLKCEAGVT